MNRILKISFLIFLLVSGALLCKKDDKDKDKNSLILFGILLSRASSSAACNPQSGFTICIPQGIAE
ncbi:MAG: hypothetical protein SH817_15460 [Leptospira sp.]|nr:hypothetical protein [Leptospira sp.]